MARLDRLSAAMWIIFAVMLPFELKTPLITIGPLSITNVELAMYGVLAVWAVRLIQTCQVWRKPDRSRLTPVHWAVLTWIAANIISALLAPTLRGEALKFAFRSATGALLFFAAADWARNADRVRPIALALGAGTVLSAGAGIIEVAMPSSVPLWRRCSGRPRCRSGWRRCLAPGLCRAGDRSGWPQPSSS